MNRFLAWFGTNEGRIVSILALLSEIGSAIWNIHLGKAVDVGPGGLGGGLAAILTASAALLAAPPAAKALLVHQETKLAAEKKHGE